jgi:hypothetical protein
MSTRRKYLGSRIYDKSCHYVNFSEDWSNLKKNDLKVSRIWKRVKIKYFMKENSPEINNILNKIIN